MEKPLLKGHRAGPRGFLGGLRRAQAGAAWAVRVLGRNLCSRLFPGHQYHERSWTGCLGFWELGTIGAG